MKRIFIILGLLSTVVLGGCSILGEVNNSVDYVNEATDYLDKARNFAEDVPQLAEDAVTNQEARKNLENELETMQQDIKDFNETKAPSIAEDIHNQIVEYNEKLNKGIDSYLQNIENGKFDPALLQDSEIVQTANELTSLMNKIENLGS
ncbi:hypothetical protein ELQ35_15385 [Peribacillus cavernae]|uniref:Lipoprotein n=1 Tax=Peribacillus cavernae TaxID=1674310 RepID=A0A3S0UBC6_9BACI|nr:DUF6376 family protein [Peribacillus cavernae]MDQ0220434.1 peptidoglycan hydrolase CwlO-like protein [Peribacillus cavernae]RUQ27550.1 hypothetical protein ELQ35_15385 [Peribacillus cavernae]